MEMELQTINYMNEKLNVEMNCYINANNEIWFRGKEIALILGYKNTRKAISDHVCEDDKQLINFKIPTLVKDYNSRSNKTLPRAESLNSRSNKTLPRAESLEKTFKCFFVNESGFYSLILSSKLPIARDFKHWVTSMVLPSIRKRGIMT